jgi:hypothetical protein
MYTPKKSFYDVSFLGKNSRQNSFFALFKIPFAQYGFSGVLFQ